MELVKHLSGKALVVIDDVGDDASQLDLLLARDCLHPDSIFILTSRDPGILKQRCDAFEEVALLKHGLDFQLLCSHAFPAGEAPPAVSSLMAEVVALCGGLPLTLKARTHYCARMSAGLPQMLLAAYCCLLFSHKYLPDSSNDAPPFHINKSLLCTLACCFGIHQRLWPEPVCKHNLAMRLAGTWQLPAGIW